MFIYPGLSKIVYLAHGRQPRPNGYEKEIVINEARLWGGVFNAKQKKRVVIKCFYFKFIIFVNMNRKEQILQRIKMVVDKNAPDSEVYLYGSQARGNAKELSDWDLLILLNTPNVSFDFETKFMDEFYELELETGEIFSPLIYPKNDWKSKYSVTPFFENIQREGIRLK